MTAWALVAIQRATYPAPEPDLWVTLEPPALLPTGQRQQIVRSTVGEATPQATDDAFLGERTRTVRRQSIKVGNAGGAPAKPAAPDLPLKSLALGDFSRLASRNPPPSEQEGVAGVSGEYVKGIQEGEQTALNTREFVFYGFFERIRSQLDRAWEPILREELIRLYKQGRRLASDQDHVTQVMVVLDREGRVVRVETLGESGTRVLDDSAVRAFNRAGPFPNPPRALLGSEGTVRIRWEFILKT